MTDAYAPRPRGSRLKAARPDPPAVLYTYTVPQPRAWRTWPVLQPVYQPVFQPASRRRRCPSRTRGASSSPCRSARCSACACSCSEGQRPPRCCTPCSPPNPSPSPSPSPNPNPELNPKPNPNSNPNPNPNPNQARASLHARNKDGEFALALCAEWTPDSRAKRVCEALIALGADPSVRCVDGSTAEKRAMGVGNMATVALLHAHAQAAAELAQRELMMEEDADGDTLGSLSGSSSRKSGRKGGQRSHGRSGRW